MTNLPSHPSMGGYRGGGHWDCAPPNPINCTEIYKFKNLPQRYLGEGWIAVVFLYWLLFIDVGLNIEWLGKQAQTATRCDGHKWWGRQDEGEGGTLWGKGSVTLPPRKLIFCIYIFIKYPMLQAWRDDRGPENVSEVKEMIPDGIELSLLGCLTYQTDGRTDGQDIQDL